MFIDRQHSLELLKDFINTVIFQDFIKNDYPSSFYYFVDIRTELGRHSYSLLRTMNCSLPLILTQPQEIVDKLDNNDRLFMNENNEKKFQNLLERLISNFELQKDVGDNSRKLIEKFSKLIVMKYLEERNLKM